jgi:protein-L-isoaspartate O-methyltransferase
MTDSIAPTEGKDNSTFQRAFERVGNLKTGFPNFAYSCNETIGQLTLRDKVVLDVGAGLGWQALYFASTMSPKTVVGIDAAEGEGAEAGCLRNLIGLRTAMEIPNVDVIGMDFIRRGLRKETFDVIMALQ